MSLILRHHPECINVTLDKNGWCDANALLLGIKNKHPEVTWVDIAEVIFNCPKKRYEILNGRIRAVQGHSAEVDIEYQSVTPTHFLYHGTPEQNVISILTTGINKSGRRHVHLSMNESTAKNVGSRRGKPIVMTIDAEKMVKDGFKFFLSPNGVFLTDFVPPEYIIAHTVSRLD